MKGTSLAVGVGADIEERAFPCFFACGCVTTSCAESEDPVLGKVWVSPFSSVYSYPQEPTCLNSGGSESTLVTQVSHRCESELSWKQKLVFTGLEFHKKTVQIWIWKQNIPKVQWVNFLEAGANAHWIASLLFVLHLEFCMRCSTNT